ncbi:MAG: hypothetical protein JKX69_00505 [Rhodobacteraceae bacterium]|nr:hypothetical protein [Paracoccaceae bacterium]
MKIRLAVSAAALLVCAPLAGLAQETALTPGEPQSVIAAVTAGENQFYALTRCAGYFKAMLTAAGGIDTEGEFADETRDAIRFLFGVAVEQRMIETGEDQSDPDKIDRAAAFVIGMVDSHRDFYLLHMLARHEEGLDIFDTMMLADRGACTFLQDQRD